MLKSYLIFDEYLLGLYAVPLCLKLDILIFFTLLQNFCSIYSVLGTNSPLPHKLSIQKIKNCYQKSQLEQNKKGHHEVQTYILSFFLLYLRMLKAVPKFELSYESQNKDLPVCLHFLNLRRLETNFSLTFKYFHCKSCIFWTVSIWFQIRKDNIFNYINIRYTALILSQMFTTNLLRKEKDILSNSKILFSSRCRLKMPFSCHWGRVLFKVVLLYPYIRLKISYRLIAIPWSKMFLQASMKNAFLPSLNNWKHT